MRHLLTLLAIACTTAAMADTLDIERVRHIGPFNVKAPLVLDSIDNSQKRYDADNIIDTKISLSAADNAAPAELRSLGLEKGTLHLMTFGLNATTYVKDAKLEVKGAKSHKIHVDGKETANLTLAPGYHSVTLKLVPDTAAVTISLIAKGCTPTTDDKHAFTMADNLGTKVISRSELSPSGRWAIISYSWYDTTNKQQYETLLCDLKSNSRRNVSGRIAWMPRSDRYTYTEHIDGKTRLVAADPATGKTSILAEELPSEYYAISPTEDFLIIHNYNDGPKKEDGVFEILHPDDRQPNWRQRCALARMDLKTGFTQPLTYTYHDTRVNDITPDGKHMLFAVSTDSLTQRPTTRSTFYDMDLSTLKVTKLVEKDGFLQGGIYAGSEKTVVFYGSTEAFNGIGKRVPEGATPNMYDYHLYVMDTATKTVTPVTADDKTSIESIDFSPADGGVYYTAQNGDSTSLYRLDMKTYRSQRIAQPMEDLTGFSIAYLGGNIMVRGSSACTPYEAYNISSPATRKARVTLVAAPNAEHFAHIKLGTVEPWTFHSTRGYDVSCHYYLPADFDTAKKYPLIVHYYGGCSPTSRRFGNGSHYPAHYWNSLGYIVLVVNPSGASGFGQEWASRHVNTMGEGPAQDIIDATRQFAREMPQVNADKIGCVSASYGGFMTQYMLTKDNNPFACGISHAGISDHTSYWGEGYWGYSYSEVSAANSYPWTRKDLYVDRSPLFNAQKIKKPLLFTHGTADTNVPIGESIQMYTALRLLGTPTAFVQVEGENHGIMEPTKRAKWINTMVAWFQKWLMDDDSWWNAIYTPKHL